MPGYEILGVLGRGGMGVVYRARHLALKRIVALKMMLAGAHASPHELARFRVEAEAVARLAHPNIVQIHEVGAAEGYPYCALEFVEGATLAQKLAGRPWPPREAARLTETLARAMQLAHSRNVVHRDLKPANILLAGEPAALAAGSPAAGYGTPKITDFGLARQLDSDSGGTQAGAVMGTPSCMAPEQASGLAHEAGPAADVYALGAILYECLTGRPPFQGKTIVETLDQVRTQEPVPPSQLARRHLAPGESRGANWPDLETICLKCLRKEPEKRYASAEALAEDLRRWQANEPILARPVGRLERLVKWAARNPLIAALLALVVLALAAGGAGIYLKYLDAQEQAAIALRQTGIAQDRAEEAERERRTAAGLAEDRRTALADLEQAHANLKTQKRQAEEERDRARFVAYAFRLREAQGLIDRGRLDQGEAVLATCEPKLCRWEHAYLLGRTRRLRLLCAGHADTVKSVAFSPDGTRLVSASQDMTVKVWDAQTGRELLTLPDGQRIVSASGDRTVKVWDAQTGQEALSLKGHGNPVSSVAFSPDGKHLVSASQDQTLRVWTAGDSRRMPEQ